MLYIGGLYYPVIIGIIISHNKDLAGGFQLFTSISVGDRKEGGSFI